MRAHRGVDGIAVEVAEVRRTSVHRHPDVIEFVYVLRGALDVQVSSERYLLEEGDFALLNAGDTHAFEGRGTCLVATMQVDVAEFAPEFPELPSKIFACESFDLPRFLGTESYLRDALLDIFEAPPEDRRAGMTVLLHDLLEFYGVEQYYDRRRVVNHNRRALIKRMLTLLQVYASERNVLERVSDEMNYSKGALSRLTRDAMGMSFTDIVTNLRLTRAEVLLLESDATMVSIAHRCGFSDVKYLTRSFRAWFGCTPAAYRKEHRGRVHAGDDLEPVADPARRIAAHRAIPLPSGRPTRRSATPIEVITSAATRESFLTGEAAAQVSLPTGVGELGGGQAGLQARGQAVTRSQLRAAAPHLLPIRVFDDDPEEPADGSGDARWRRLLMDADRHLYRPVLVLPAERRAEALELLADLRAAEAGGSDGSESVEIEVWVSYRFGGEQAAEAVASELRALPGVVATPMLAA